MIGSLTFLGVRIVFTISGFERTKSNWRVFIADDTKIFLKRLNFFLNLRKTEFCDEIGGKYKTLFFGCFPRVCRLVLAVTATFGLKRNAIFKTLSYLIAQSL